MSISPKSGLGGAGLSPLSGIGRGGISISGEAPVANFTGTPLTGTGDTAVTFTDTSSNTPTSWLWEKNSGSGWSNFAGTPTVQNPVETLAAGTWSIRLTASNATGANTKTRTSYVEISAAPSYTGPLDLVPGAVVAYSAVRALSAAMLGQSLYTLRRASDDAELAWSTNASTGLIDQDAIEAWAAFGNVYTKIFEDQSGNSKALVQATAENQFRWRGYRINDLPDIGEQGDGPMLAATGSTFSSGAVSFIIVCRGQAVEFNFGSAPGDFVRTAISNADLVVRTLLASDGTRSAGAEYESDIFANEFAIWDGVWKFGSHSMRRNGVALTATDDLDDVGAVQTINEAFELIKDGFSGTAFVEIIFYDAELSAPNRAALLTEVATFYNLIGAITGASLNAGGSGYTSGDSAAVGGGNGNAIYNVETVADYSGAVTAVNQGAHRFTVAGDRTKNFPAFANFDVAGSTGNDGTYTVSSSALNGGSTEVIVDEAIPSAVADGSITSPYGAVLTFGFDATGSGYLVASGVATTPSSTGSGLVINITSVLS